MESWTAPLTVLSVDCDSGTVTVPESNGKLVKAAFGDVRLTIHDDSSAELVHDANDDLYDYLQALLMNDQPGSDAAAQTIDESSYVADDNQFEPCFVIDDALSVYSTDAQPSFDEPSNTPNDSNDQTQAATITNHLMTQSVEPKVGDKIKIFWPLDTVYYLVLVFVEQNNNKTVFDNDSGIETLDVATETWR